MNKQALKQALIDTLLTVVAVCILSIIFESCITHAADPNEPIVTDVNSLGQPLACKVCRPE